MAISATYVNGHTFTISGSNETEEFHAGRRVQANCGTDGYKYSTVSGSSFSVDTTVVVYPDPGDDLTNKLTSVKYGIVSATDSSLPTHSHLNDNGQGGQITESSITDLDKYTQSEIDNLLTTTSGDIVSQIPTDFYSKSDVDTISGSLSSEIDSDISTHASSSDHDSRYYTETEVNTWRNSVTQTEMGYLHGVTSDVQTQLDNAGGISNVSEDTTPELGGNLDFLTYTISGTGTIVTGGHGTSTHPEVVNVVYGTSSPTLSGVPEGTLYIEYEV